MAGPSRPGKAGAPSLRPAAGDQLDRLGQPGLVAMVPALDPGAVLVAVAQPQRGDAVDQRDDDRLAAAVDVAEGQPLEPASRSR